MKSHFMGDITFFYSVTGDGSDSDNYCDPMPNDSGSQSTKQGDNTPKVKQLTDMPYRLTTGYLHQKHSETVN